MIKKKDADKMNEIIYSKELSEQWMGEKSLQHPSRVWGRIPMLEYLAKKILRHGDRVLDLGCGGGYPTLQVAKMVGEGFVTGVELSKAQLGLERGQEPISKKYGKVKNIRFINLDARNLEPIKDKSVDVVVSFMMLHNLVIEDVERVFNETGRVLRSNGLAVFLTLHPDLVKSEPWDLIFMEYESGYKDAVDDNGDAKEGFIIETIVKMHGGGEKKVFTVVHERRNIKKAIENSKLKIIDKKEIWIDEKKARELFGDDSVKKLPTQPAFWMITCKKRDD